MTSINSLDQINEDFYKNLFRLLHSTKAEASAELRKIGDDLTALYESKGITEYFPPIPGDSIQSTNDGGSSASSDFTPTSTRKFEKPVAPIRKDSLAADRVSPHLSALRSNSPRHPSTTTIGGDTLLTAATIPKPSPPIHDDQSTAEIMESTSFMMMNASTDSADEGFQSSSSSNTPLASLELSTSSESGEPTATTKRKLSPTDIDAATAGNITEKGTTSKKRSLNDESDNTSMDEPVEKKAKLESSAIVQRFPQIKIESEHDLESLKCVVCKSVDLDAGNLMVECHECHNMYHQKCHQPNVPSSQINDPRMLWYCHQCDKKNQKRADATTASPKTTPSSATAARRNTANSTAREDKKSSIEEKSNILKRSSTAESKDKPQAPIAASKPADILSKAATLLEKHKKKVVPSPSQKASGSAGNTNPFAMALSSAANSAGSAKLATSSTTTGGLSKLANTVQQQSAATAANNPKPGIAGLTLTVSSSPSSSSSSSASNSKQMSTSSSQMQAAEKRLQMMKKKAAMKGSFKI